MRCNDAWHGDAAARAATALAASSQHRDEQILRKSDQLSTQLAAINSSDEQIVTVRGSRFTHMNGSAVQSRALSF